MIFSSLFYFGAVGRETFSTFDRAIRYNLFSRTSKKGFSLLSRSSSSIYLFSSFIEKKTNQGEITLWLKKLFI
jgi:hypothetical protein